MKRALWFLTAAAILVTTATVAQSTPELTFEARVEAQRAIEQVYWQQRLWPGQDAKPALDQVMPTAAIEAKVTDYLKKSAALEQLWQRPLTREALQAELDRMVRSTKAPETLRSLFAALDDDGYVIAETLVRQKLADRMLRNWYAGDRQLHAEIRREAEQALAASTSVDDWILRGAEYSAIAIARSDDATALLQPASTTQLLNGAQWDDAVRSLSQRLGTDLPSGVWSALSDETTGFEIVRVQRTAEETMTVESVRWPKQAFEQWWSGMSSELAPGDGGAPENYTAGVPQGSCTSGEWGALPTAPQGRRGHTAVWTGSEMIVWSGGASTGYGGLGYDTGGRYDPATDSWQSTSKSGAPSIRTNHTAVWTGSEMLVWGGRDGAEFGSSLDNGGRYDPVSDSWQPMSTVGAASAREEHTTVWTGSEMLVWGGIQHVYQGGPDVWLGSGGSYDPVSDSWSAISGVGAPSGRARHTMVWTGSSMIVWGGWEGPNNLGDGAAYDPVSDSWSTISNSGDPSVRSGHSAVWTGSEMIVWGGLKGNYHYQDGARYSPASDSWTPTSPVGAPAIRAQHTAIWTGSRMIVWGGKNLTNELDTGGVYDPLTNTWTPTNRGPARRTGHTAVWTGSEMLVWGGSDLVAPDGVDYLDSGSRYDPVNDSWAPTFSANSPRRRAWHTSVWTGAEMIVWGGLHYGNGYLNSGGCYDPATDVWIDTAMTGAPQGRRNHTAVWTGSEMIVWGGYDVNTQIGVNYLKNGGSYNPATSTWVPTSDVNSPSKRCKHTAVWTGSEMIVWGGSGHSGLMSYGKRYHRATDTWLNHSLVDQPEKRYLHTAVWTGSEMLIWGGGGSGMGVNFPRAQGASYNPGTDSWAPITMAGQPLETNEHTAVWTGSEMIVWGGIDMSNSLVSSGGVYDPADDSWTLTSLVDAPPAARQATAVWTGSNMIVWGGKGTGSADLNSGGVYNPTADSWSATSTDQAPKARWEHTGVWSGSEMLIFGGESDNASFLADGGRLCALDSDADGALDELDCDAADGSTWSAPGEVGMLTLSGAGMTEIGWSAPVNPGGAGLTYDVLRADGADGFMSPICVATDTTSTSAGDPSPPTPGNAYFYLVIAKNGCGTSLGAGSDGNPRQTLSCD